MKRPSLWSLALALFCLCAALTGCGGGSDDNTPSAASTTQITAPFTGRTYQSAVTLDNGNTATLHVTVNAQSLMSGVVAINDPRRAATRLMIDTVSVTGTLNPFTREFTLTGSFVSNGITIPVNISGTLPGTVDTAVGSALWSVNGINYRALLEVALGLPSNPDTPDTPSDPNTPGDDTPADDMPPVEAPADGTLRFSDITGNVTGTSFTPTIARVNDSFLDNPVTRISLQVEDTKEGEIKLRRFFSLLLPPNLTEGTVVNFASGPSASGQTYNAGWVEYRDPPGADDDLLFPYRTFGTRDTRFGTVEVVDVTNNIYTLRLTNVRLAALGSTESIQSDSTGSFLVNGTVYVNFGTK